MIVQVPALTSVIVLDEIVQTGVVTDVKVTVNVLLADAEIAYVPLPKVLLLSEPKVIVCAAFAIVNVAWVAVDPRWLVDSV